ncbi:MAG: exodeoxyribonuclease VII large subunit [Kangiellaceae bacterium]|nr:exodeoxyribonuclease VII large subunit [Kangiellaceae bacterium]
MRKPFLQPQNLSPPTQRQVLTVSQLNQKAKSLMELELGAGWLEGEISNFIQATSGHWYFTLKDNNAQIKCVIFKFKNRLIKISPQEGDKVIVKGKVSLYEARGDYQMIADYMEPSGIGELQQELNALIKKLEAQQLFAASNKKKLPFLPKAIGVITSPSGAAIRDIITVLERRCPMIPIIIYPSVVQGREASIDISAALNTAISRNECDVLLITRGGGSLEDLWCFNNEQLALQIAACEIPIVAAIGHEVDVTITELVADLRAATPSAAAELIAPEQQVLWQKLDVHFQVLNDSINSIIYQLQTRLNIARLKLKDPVHLIQTGQHQLDKLTHRLQLSYVRQVRNQRIALDNITKKLVELNPKEKLIEQKHKLETVITRLETAIQESLRSRQIKLSLLAGGLNTLSPLSTLSRGYSIIRDKKTYKVINSVTQMSKNQELSVLLSDGEIDCRVY